MQCLRKAKTSITKTILEEFILKANCCGRKINCAISQAEHQKLDKLYTTNDMTDVISRRLSIIYHLPDRFSEVCAKMSEM